MDLISSRSNISLLKRASITVGSESFQSALIFQNSCAKSFKLSRQGATRPIGSNTEARELKANFNVAEELSSTGLNRMHIVSSLRFQPIPKTKIIESCFVMRFSSGNELTKSQKLEVQSRRLRLAEERLSVTQSKILTAEATILKLWFTYKLK